MTTFLLVHSPLLGPTTWRAVAEELEHRGHHGIVVSLREATRAGPPFVERQAAAIVAVAEGDPRGGAVVLTGHSGAGPLLPAASRALGSRATMALFVDATLPMPGRTRLDDLHPAFQGRLLSRIADGMLPPWHEWWNHRPDEVILDPEVRDRFFDELEPLPLGMFTEPFPEVDGWPAHPCAYLRLSDSYASEEATAAGLGWPVTRLSGSHFEVIANPAKVVDSMLALVGRLEP